MGKPVELTIRGEGKDTALAKEIICSVKLHQKLMGLEDWYGHVIFKKVEEEDGGDTMETECWPHYRKFELTVDLESVAVKKEYINHYVRHEFIHVLIWGFFDIAGELCYKRTEGALRKLEENTIYALEHMPLWDLVYPAGDMRHDPK
jgi:hypothetical protein